MNPERLLQHFDRISEAPDAIPRLRRFILDLAVRGKLVEQNPNDEPAAELLKSIAKHIGKSLEAISQPDTDEPFELPLGWKWSQLGLVTTKTGSGSTPRGGQAVYQSEGIPFLRSQNVYNEGLRLNDVAYITEETHAKMIGTAVKPGDLLLNITGGSIGRCCRIPDDPFNANISQHVAIIRLAVSGMVDFSHKLVLSPFFQSYVIDEQTGAGRGGLPKNRMDKIPFPLPPLAEQHRIVAKVDELMALCDRLRAAQSEREQHRDRLVVASLNKLNQSEQSRRPGRDCRDPDFRDESNAKPTKPAAILAKQPAKIAEAPIAYLPVNWIPAIPAGTTGFDDVRFVLENLPRLTTRPAHIKQLRQTIINLAVRGKLVAQDPNDSPVSELLKNIDLDRRRIVKEGKAKLLKPLPEIQPEAMPFQIPSKWAWVTLNRICHKVSDGFHHTPTKLSEGIKYISATHIWNGWIEWDSGIYVSEKEYGELYKKVGQKYGDILIVNRGAGCGDAAIVDSIEPFCFQNAAIIGFNQDLIFGKYVLYYLRSSKEKLLESFVQGGAQPMLSNKLLASHPIALPPFFEQQRIVTKVDELMALCDQLETQLTSTATDSRRLLEAVLHEALLPASEQAA